MTREKWESRFRGPTLLAVPLGWDAFGKDLDILPQRASKCVEYTLPFGRVPPRKLDAVGSHTVYYTEKPTFQHLRLVE